MSIPELIHIIRTKIYGEEIRGAIADSIAELDLVKDERMPDVSEWPEDNYFSPNKLYTFGRLENQHLIFIFDDGTIADDMIYISFEAGYDLSAEFQGNYVGLSGFSPLPSFAEIVGMWNPVHNTWVFTYRRLIE